MTKPVFDDPATQHFIRQGVARLRDEFHGIFSESTIQRFVDEAIASLAGARVKDYVPLFVNRFARERLRALAQVQGAIRKDIPEVLFVCDQRCARTRCHAAEPVYSAHHRHAKRRQTGLQAPMAERRLRSRLQCGGAKCGSPCSAWHWLQPSVSA